MILTSCGPSGYSHGGDIQKLAFADADHAGCKTTRRLAHLGSIQPFGSDRLFKLGRPKSKKAAISSNGSWIYALSVVVLKVLWMRSQLRLWLWI
ncbi:hypothetical protein Tco_0553180 [Tanacetum coccineum]